MDATVGGTRLTLADDAQATVALPFSFRYYGQPFTSVTVSSNGFLVFGPSPATAWINSPLPNTAAPQRRRRRLLGRPQPRPQRRRHLVPQPRHSPQPQTRDRLDRRPPRRHRRRNQLPSHPRRRKQRDPARLPGHPARKPSPGPRRLRHHRNRITRRHPRHQFLHNQPLLAPYQATTALRYTNRPAGPPDTQAPAVPTGLTATAGDCASRSPGREQRARPGRLPPLQAGDRRKLGPAGDHDRRRYTRRASSPAASQLSGHGFRPRDAGKRERALSDGERDSASRPDPARRAHRAAGNSRRPAGRAGLGGQRRRDRRLSRLPKRQPDRQPNEQRLHRYRPHERQHVHLPRHRPRPGRQRKRPLQPGQRQPASTGHPTRRDQLPAPPGAVLLGGRDRRRDAAGSGRRCPGDRGAAVQLPLLRAAVHERHASPPTASSSSAPARRPPGSTARSPAPPSPNGVVAAYWDDLNPALGGGASGTATSAPLPTASS